jgi:hypothetical protein
MFGSLLSEPDCNTEGGVPESRVRWHERPGPGQVAARQLT